MKSSEENNHPPVLETSPLDLSTIGNKVKEYEAALTLITDKRERWKKETKKVLFETLNMIREAYSLDWTVQKIEECNNLEEVHIRFNKTQSGVMERKGQETRPCIKYGGVLVFDQEYNGDVPVIVVYPHVAGCVDRIPDRKLDRIAPENITEVYIALHVVKFLDEMIKWETSNTKNAIGFKLYQ